MMSSHQNMGPLSVPNLSRVFNSFFFKLLIAFFFLLGLLLLLPASQAALFSVGGRLAGKSLNAARWGEFFTEYGGKMLLSSLLMASYFVRNRIVPERRRTFDTAFLSVVFVLWAVFAGTSVLLHEPWRDELQAWGIARALSPAGIFHEMRYEGHFVPWFYLFIPFAKLGFPLLTLNLVSFCIMGGCVFLLLFKSPFSIYAKAAVVMTVPLAYYYTVISRCYCLYALCVLTLACLYGRRTEKPFLYALLLGLLANCHA